MLVERSEVEARENETLSLTCPVKAGSTGPQLEWRRGNAPVQQTEAVQRSENNHKLHFLHIQRSHSGIYECEAVNEAGSATSIFDVRVLGRF